MYTSDFLIELVTNDFMNEVALQVETNSVVRNSNFKIERVSPYGFVLISFTQTFPHSVSICYRLFKYNERHNEMIYIGSFLYGDKANSVFDILT